MSANPGQRQKPKAVKAAARKRGRRPTLVEVEPLFATYGAANPPGAYSLSPTASGLRPEAGD